MLGHSLWLAEWRPDVEAFDFRQVFDFTPFDQAMPLEVYFNGDARRAYVTTANPGHLNAFDITDPRDPKHLGAAATAGGAHHMVFSADGTQAFVQNGLLNLPGMNGGSITVVDLAGMKPVGSIDVFKDAGRSINMIELTAQDGGAHAH